MTLVHTAALVAALAGPAPDAPSSSVRAMTSVPVAPPALLEDTVKRLGDKVRVSMRVYSIAAALAGRTLADLPGHRHEGHVYVYVLEGHVRSKLDDGPEMVFSAGQAWMEQPGQLHRILNPIPGTTARLLVVSLDPAQ